MLSLKIKQLTQQEELQQYINAYQDASGFEVPLSYLENSKVFGISRAGVLLSGFVLADGIDFRTIRTFAKEENQDEILDLLEVPENFTELTCFWIKRDMQTNNWVNLYTWVNMALYLKYYSKKYILFGTNSKSLARLYSQTEHTVLFHKDRVMRKNTYIFIAQRQYCIRGILTVVASKFKRLVSIKFNLSSNKVIPQLQRVQNKPVSNLWNSN